MGGGKIRDGVQTHLTLPQDRTGVTNLCSPCLEINQVAVNTPLLETNIKDHYFKLKPFQHKKIDCTVLGISPFTLFL